eukprot:TRINITY_DN17815_c0_g1_i1.p1 TRINITY_DN17815_c0_g1~~TRINITY_DN17815_c0_g1_i1.p1  ORF type:complete len:103 (+),score=7.71 TRINITY_DN17815_c0_g1_i1:73-381(+)
MSEDMQVDGNGTASEEDVSKLSEQVADIRISDMENRLTTSKKYPEIPDFFKEAEKPQQPKPSKSSSGKLRPEKPLPSPLVTDLVLQRRPQGGWRWVRKHKIK